MRSTLTTMSIITQNPWAFLRRYTAARIALGRCGNALPTREVLALNLAHAQARDAVWAELDATEFQRQLQTALGVKCVIVRSRAANRDEYVRRPDLGRRLSEESVAALVAARGDARSYDIAVICADGLSAVALQRHTISTLQALMPRLSGLALAPLVIAQSARVAIGDEIGELLRAGIAAVFIGERPGLSAPDSLGIYLTYAPRIGRTDAERNCISNIRAGGLSYHSAAARLADLIADARSRRMTGVLLSKELPEQAGPSSR